MGLGAATVRYSTLTMAMSCGCGPQGGPHLDTGLARGAARSVPAGRKPRGMHRGARACSVWVLGKHRAARLDAKNVHNG